MHDTFYTVGAVAAMFGLAPWQIRRLFERGLLPPARRIGLYRVIVANDLPKVEKALRAAGYLSEEAACSAGFESCESGCPN